MFMLASLSIRNLADVDCHNWSFYYGHWCLTDSSLEGLVIPTSSYPLSEMFEEICLLILPSRNSHKMIQLVAVVAFFLLTGQEVLFCEQTQY